MAESLIKNDWQWKHFCTKDGDGFTDPLPESWRELAIKVYSSASPNYDYSSYSFYITRHMINDGTILRQGFYKSASDWSRAHLLFSVNSGQYSVKVSDYEISGSSITDRRMDVEYR